MATNNKTINVGEGYSVNVTAYLDAVITHQDQEMRNSAFGDKSLVSQEDLKNFYERIEYARTHGMGIVINVSNHPSKGWGLPQIQACGDAIIVDVPFPNINPSAEADELDVACFGFADWLVSTVNGKIDKDRTTFVIAGAQGALFRIVGFLKMAGYAVMEATSERNTTVNADGSKTVHFDFVRFRSF